MTAPSLLLPSQIDTTDLSSLTGSHSQLPSAGHCHCSVLIFLDPAYTFVSNSLLNSIWIGHLFWALVYIIHKYVFPLFIQTLVFCSHSWLFGFVVFFFFSISIQLKFLSVCTYRLPYFCVSVTFILKRWMERWSRWGTTSSQMKW